MKFLVVAAHPDDEVLGCGGTAAKLVAQGWEGFVHILGEGITSRDHIRDTGARKNEIAELHANIKSANKHLGIQQVFTSQLPDNRFDQLDLIDIVKEVEAKVSHVKPDLIFTHYENDLNIDHQLTYRAVITAARPLQSCSVKEIYSFEILSSTEWKFPLTFSPDTFSDISKNIGQKLSAMKEYGGELRDFPHPRSLKGIELTSEYWGMRVGQQNTEAFKLVRKNF